jgi:membrane dipeptidase
MFIVDAHLDLAYNVTCGRDVTRPASEQPARENEIASVGLPDLRAGQVKLICATIFAEPASKGEPGYTDAETARQAALTQLRWYQSQNEAGTLEFVTDAKQLSTDAMAGDAIRALLLLEGADPIRTPADVRQWFDDGLRIVGLAWRQTRHAGGTGCPGPLTAAGVALVQELDRFGIIHDTSHLAEESFWQLAEMSEGPLIASHSNCRAIVPTDRQLSDAMIQAIVARGGVIGINFFDKFLIPPADRGARRATLVDVIRHMRHICDLAGNCSHVGIGTDMDGGLGRDQIPQEITTSADLPRLGDALSQAGFNDNDIASIIGENWRRYFANHLPRQ